MEGSKKHKGVVPVVIMLGISMVFWILVFGITFAVVMGYVKKFTGAFGGIFGNNTCINGEVTCPSGTLSGFAKGSSWIVLVNQNMAVYKSVESKSGVPWEVIAAIHYREGSMSPNRSLCEGEKIGNACTCLDPNQVVGKTLEESAMWTANHLQGKAQALAGKKITGWDEETIKRALFGYNGATERYKEQAVRLGFPRNPGYDGSPYVMANFDQRHDAKLYRKCKNNGCSNYSYGESQDGAFTVASLIKNGEYDSSGKLLSVGGCNAVASGSSNSQCASNVESTLTGGMGSEIAGQFYPPYGDKMKSAAKSVNSSPHNRKGHGLFGVSQFGEGFRNNGDCAIDWNVTRGSQVPIYATFDGKIVGVTYPNHKSSYGKGGGVLWLKSSDGKHGAIFAHIKFVDGIQKGTEVKRGQQIAVTARNCKWYDLMCVTFKGSDHLHYQLYANGVGVEKQDLIKLFPHI